MIKIRIRPTLFLRKRSVSKHGVNGSVHAVFNRVGAAPAHLRVRSLLEKPSHVLGQQIVDFVDRFQVNLFELAPIGNLNLKELRFEYLDQNLLLSHLQLGLHLLQVRKISVNQSVIFNQLLVNILEFLNELFLSFLFAENAGQAFGELRDQHGLDLDRPCSLDEIIHLPKSRLPWKTL